MTQQSGSIYSIQLSAGLGLLNETHSLLDLWEPGRVVVEVTKSTMVHSVVEDGTWKRLQRGNREMTSKEVNELSFARGVISAETETVPVPFELLDSDYWKTFCQTRKLTTGDISDRMFRIGLAKKKNRPATDPCSGPFVCGRSVRDYGMQGGNPYFPLYWNAH
jgi:hypothetical protein